MDKVAHFGFMHYNNDDLKKMFCNHENFKPYISEDANSGQIRISLFHEMINDPNKQRFNNQVQVKTTELNVLWPIKPYKSNPYASNFRCSLLGNTSDNIWNPPENEPLKSRTEFMNDLLNKFQDDIVPQIILNIGNYKNIKEDDKKKLYKSLKLKAKDEKGLLDEIRSKINPCIKQGEFEDKLYNPELRVKLRTYTDEDTQDTKYRLDLYDERGKEINSIHEELLNIEHELVKGTKFMAIMSLSLYVKDNSLNLMWEVSEIAIMSRPAQAAQGPKQSSFADDIESYQQDCEMDKVNEEMATNNIEDSSEEDGAEGEEGVDSSEEEEEEEDEEYKI